MRFSRLRRSRLAMGLIAASVMPCMMLCCVAGSFSDASVSDNPVMASMSPGTASHHCDSRNSDSKNSESAPAERSCCELMGNADFTVEKGGDFDARPDLVATALTSPVEQVVPEFLDIPSTLIGIRAHGPPLFLRNSSFLI